MGVYPPKNGEMHRFILARYLRNGKYILLLVGCPVQVLNQIQEAQALDNWASFGFRLWPASVGRVGGSLVLVAALGLVQGDSSITDSSNPQI